jgi:hypothetical protein
MRATAPEAPIPRRIIPPRTTREEAVVVALTVEVVEGTPAEVADIAEAADIDNIF